MSTEFHHILPVTNPEFIASGITIHFTAAQYTALGHMYLDAIEYCAAMREAHLAHENCTVTEYSDVRGKEHDEVRKVIDAAVSAQFPSYHSTELIEQIKKAIAIIFDAERIKKSQTGQ